MSQCSNVTFRSFHENYRKARRQEKYLLSRIQFYDSNIIRQQKINWSINHVNYNWHKNIWISSNFTFLFLEIRIRNHTVSCWPINYRIKIYFLSNQEKWILQVKYCSSHINTYIQLHTENHTRNMFFTCYKIHAQFYFNI